MKTFFVAFITLLIALLATAVPTEPCEYVEDEYFLTDAALVKECFDDYQVPQDFVDTLSEAFDMIGDIYPYVDIARHPPDDKYFITVDYNKGLADLKTAFKSSGNVLKNIVRPAQKFVAQFRDGHFGLKFSGMKQNDTKNLFATVYAHVPFNWDLHYDDKGKASIRLSLNKWSEHFLDETTQKLIEDKESVSVESFDGNNEVVKLFPDFFGEYNMMKSVQGRLQYSRMMFDQGFALLRFPLDDGILFNNHTIVFADGETFTFSMGFTNQKNKKSVRDAIPPETNSLFSFATMKQEQELRRKLETYNPDLLFNKKNVKDNEPDYVHCEVLEEEQLNFLTIHTFMPDDTSTEGILLFVGQIGVCAGRFDENEYPIVIVLPTNGGGVGLIEQTLEFFFMPNSGNEEVAACRKTDLNRIVAVDEGYYEEFANLTNCVKFNANTTAQAFETTEIDIFGDVEHKRTRKVFAPGNTYAQLFYDGRMKKHVRKPTDIILATDGFCFSSCSFLVDNVIRGGKAIVTGYGSAAPGDEQFVAGQCPSSVIQLGEYFMSENLTRNGITFTVTFSESYNVSATMNETIPGDYEILRIDKHLRYHNWNFNPDKPNYTDMAPYIKAVHEEFKTKCNPLNKRLFLVDDNCTVSDPNALTAGHPCKSDKTWDTTKCLISTCKPGFIVDFDNNKCVEQLCDYRPPPTPSSSKQSASSSKAPVPPAHSSSKVPASGSTMVNPMFGIVMFILSILAYFVY